MGGPGSGRRAGSKKIGIKVTGGKGERKMIANTAKAHRKAAGISRSKQKLNEKASYNYLKSKGLI